jgi:hypothetical protein
MTGFQHPGIDLVVTTQMIGSRQSRVAAAYDGDLTLLVTD